ncbi:MAG TPA: cyclomaltodextrinase N-terminal domain-containing protein, partial [Pyrinomonadaceae bacterium]|nr:cyclomaltodextrinase N-terminal domain-containing protein [Pyrinomonadaceae bacterium]
MRRAAFVSFILIISSVSVFAQSAPTVTKVDPPSWWSNHTINPIRLLIRGKNLSGARVRSGDARLTVTNLRQNSNYIFLDLHVASGT